MEIRFKGFYNFFESVCLVNDFREILTLPMKHQAQSLHQSHIYKYLFTLVFLSSMVKRFIMHTFQTNINMTRLLSRLFQIIYFREQIWNTRSYLLKVITACPNISQSSISLVFIHYVTFLGKKLSEFQEQQGMRNRKWITQEICLKQWFAEKLRLENFWILLIL